MGYWEEAPGISRIDLATSRPARSTSCLSTSRQFRQPRQSHRPRCPPCMQAHRMQAHRMQISVVNVHSSALLSSACSLLHGAPSATHLAADRLQIYSRCGLTTDTHNPQSLTSTPNPKATPNRTHNPNPNPNPNPIPQSTHPLAPTPTASPSLTSGCTPTLSPNPNPHLHPNRISIPHPQPHPLPSPLSPNPPPRLRPSSPRLVNSAPSWGGVPTHGT